MPKPLLLGIIALLGLTVLARADDSFTIGSATFSAPPGWTKSDGNDTHLTFDAPNGRQQATISLIRFDEAPSFDDFKLICRHRYEAEKNGIRDLVLMPTEPNPHNQTDHFTMTFSGEENPTGRVFAGFMSLKGLELVIIYVEGIRVTAEANNEPFLKFRASLKQ